jgi:hypothetical protein
MQRVGVSSSVDGGGAHLAMNNAVLMLRLWSVY